MKAGNEWAKKASLEYQYRPCLVPVLLVIPTRPEVSVKEQVDRWDGLLSGPVDVLSVDGPPHHLNLLERPWVSAIGDAISKSLNRNLGAKNVVAK